MAERSPQLDVLIVGADEAAAAELTALPELAGLTTARAILKETPCGIPSRAAVVFATDGDGVLVDRWLDALSPAPTLLVAKGGATAPHVEVVRRDSVAPRLLRVLQSCEASASGPALEFCLALLGSASEPQMCQAIAEESARLTGATWAAVLRITAEARAFEIAGSVGSVPAALHGCDNMTPDELAAALGWRVDRAPVQFVAKEGSAVARALCRGGAVAAFALLAGQRAHQAIAIAGWTAPERAPANALASLGAVADLGGDSLMHADLIADLKVSERTKSEFVATMSHELRNPLTAILGYTELMAHGDFGSVGDEQREVLRRAHQSARSLLDLINATLDVSRVEVGGRVDQDAEIDLVAVLREQIEESSNHRDDVRVDLVEAGEVWIVSDPLKVKVAVRQLLEAALAANRGVALRMTAGASGEGFAVEIAPEDMGDLDRSEPMPIELPEEGDMPAIPFTVIVARRLLEILGGTLALWHDDHGEPIAFRMWIPGR